MSFCLGLCLAVGADNLIDPVAAPSHGVKGQVAGALVDGAGDPGAGIAEAIDELLAGEGVGEDPHVQALRAPVLQDPNLDRHTALGKKLRRCNEFSRKIF